MKERKIFPYRKDFWKFCENRDNYLRSWCKSHDVPCDIDKYFIDEMFIDQKYCCAISRIQFEPPKYREASKRHPFGPSIDRIVPKNGYTRGNVRLVCTMVNLAMSNWGEESLWKLARAMGTQMEQSGEIFKAFHGYNRKQSIKSVA